MVTRYILFTFFLILPCLIHSQNLVNNPSFECGADVCDRDTDHNQFGYDVCYWGSSTFATPDIFSTSVATTCFGGQPNTQGLDKNQPGSQMPHSGKKFAGIFAYGNRVNYPKEYREYISTKLIQPLVVGEYYRVSMFVSCASHMNFASNNLGFYFSVGWHLDVATNQALTFYQPQVIEKEIITSNKWMKVCGTFQATEPATMLTIGNFSDDENTQGIVVHSNSSIDDYYMNAYYFIDDVSVEKIPGPDLLTITLSGNQTICQNESTSLTVLEHFDKITWTTLADTTKTISSDSIFHAAPNVTTTYHVEVKNCSASGQDTVTVHVNPTPKIDLGNDTTLCTGSILTLNPGPGFSNYLWQDNSTSQDFHVAVSGNYSVTVKNQFGCSGQASVNIDYMFPPKVDLGRDTLICLTFAQLNASNKNSSYLWSSGATDSVFTPTSAGKYWVTAQNQCGQASDSVQIFSLDDIFYPNVVTLNNDGKNEKFKVIGIGDNIDGRLKIYNRWGEIIFSDPSYENNWPTNDDLPSGVYYFILNYPGCPRNYKGWIEVLK
jgi:gliding motility-associated-like protein